MRRKAVLLEIATLAADQLSASYNQALSEQDFIRLSRGASSRTLS